MSPDQISSATSSRQEAVRAELISKAREYINVPWKHMGRTKSGIDCIGLPYVIGKEMGLHDYDDSVPYSRQARDFDFMRKIAPYGFRVRDMTDLRDGDIIVMRIPIFPQHVVMVSHIGDRQTIIHASVDARKVVEEYLSDEVRRKIIAVFRYKDLA